MYILLYVLCIGHYALVCISIHSVTFWDSIFIVQLLSNLLCPIIVVIVHYSDDGNVFQVFRSRSQYLHGKSTKDRRVLKAYCHQTVVTSQDIQNQFLQIGSKWARHLYCIDRHTMAAKLCWANWPNTLTPHSWPASDLTMFSGRWGISLAPDTDNALVAWCICNLYWPQR